MTQMYREIPLNQLEVGKTAVIHRIETGDNKVLNKLMAFGALPGVEVELMQKFPSNVIKMGNTTIAADDNIAKSIIVVVA